MRGVNTLIVALTLTIMASSCGKASKTERTEVIEGKNVVAPGAVIEKIAGGFGFTEGPAVDCEGNLYFTDEKGDTVHKLTPAGVLSTVIENTGQGTGLYVDKNCNLLLCEQDKAFHRLVSLDSNFEITVLADEYDGKPLNAPNDVWVHPGGGIYFTDPNWKDTDDPSRVYYMTPDRSQLIPVIEDLEVPNGVVGSLDGKSLYVTDGRINLTYEYSIESDGTLSGKTLFAEEGEDGLTVDAEGNVYITSSGISVYNSDGEKIETIEVPESTSNICFGGKDMRTLYITAQTSLYAIIMNVRGL
ncbi:SMP-30/gluconolactonase/LRE family protein [Candidatus Latescibacterota bacterium]